MIIKILTIVIIMYIGLKVLYTIIGIVYEWKTKQKRKGFTLNLIASVILSLLYLTVPYQIFLKFNKRKIGTVLDELVGYEYDKAASRDQTGNVVHRTLLNKLLILPQGYKCGDKDETLSGVLGINQVLHYIKNPLGVWLVNVLDKIEHKHCFISIDENDIRWKDLSDKDRVLLKRAITNDNTD